MTTLAIVGALALLLISPFLLCLGFVALAELAIHLIAPHKFGDVPDEWRD